MSESKCDVGASAKTNMLQIAAATNKLSFNFKTIFFFGFLFRYKKLQKEFVQTASENVKTDTKQKKKIHKNQ